MKIANYLTLAFATLAIGQVSAADTSVFAGISAAENSTFGHVGGVWAMNGDLDKDGMLLRGMLSYGQYDYDTTAVPGGNVEGDAFGAELGVGYQWVTPGSRFSIYGGVDYQDHDLSPNDPSNSVNGSETGAIVQAEIETLGSPWYGNLIGKYSTTYDSYWVRGRAGYAFGNITIGPELVLGGNNEYDETGYGLFLSAPITQAVAFTISAGHRNAEGDGSRKDESGAYVAAGISAKF